MPHDRYQTVQELAERLEVAEATVRQWIKAGLLRAIDIGKGWRIADTDLELFLKLRETAPRSCIDRSNNASKNNLNNASSTVERFSPQPRQS